MSTQKQTHKLSDEQFLEALRASGGNFTKTAIYIRQHFNMYYTKQSAQRRAKGHPGEFAKLLAILGNDSTANLFKFAEDESNDIRLRIRLYLYIVNRSDKMLRYARLSYKKPTC